MKYRARKGIIRLIALIAVITMVAATFGSLIFYLVYYVMGGRI